MIALFVVRSILYLVLGGVLAVAYISALGWNVRLYLDHGAGRGAMLFHVMRLLVIGAAFTICARRSALPLLSSLVGFQIMRTVAVNRQSRAFEIKS